MAAPVPTQQSIDVQIAHLERELLELKRQRNGLSPILALPPEIFCQILLATSSPHDPYSFVDLPQTKVERYIETLCHVSHYWRMTALGCPELWAGIDIGTSTDGRKVDFMLDHARPLPISLYVDANPPDRQYRQLAAQESVMRALSHGVPFEALAFSGNLRFITELLQNARPSTLQSLRVNVLDKRSVGYTAAGASIAKHPLFTRGRPELRALAFEGCAIPLTSPILLRSPHLTSLSLPLKRESSATQVLEMLKAAPQLQRLNLEFRGPLSPSPANLDPVHLPHLSTVLFRGDSGSIGTMVSSLRLSATTVNINLICSLHDRSQMPVYGATLFRAIGEARCPTDRTRDAVLADESFSPEILTLADRHPSEVLGDMCYLILSHWRTQEKSKLARGAAKISAAEVAIAFFDHSTSSYIHWSNWHPLVLAKHPRDLQFTTGWSVDRLVLVTFINDDANYPDLFWEFLSQCPRVAELAVTPIHMPQLIPHLYADNGDLPFPSLRSMAVQGAVVRDTAAHFVVRRKYDSHLESLLEGLRKRQILCAKYGINKTWMLEKLTLDRYITIPSARLLHAALAEGLVGRFPEAQN